MRQPGAGAAIGRDRLPTYEGAPIVTSTRIDVDLPSGARMAAHLARPEGTTTGMGVVLPQEVFGINANKPGHE